MGVKLSVIVQGSVPTPDLAGAIARSHSRVSRLGIAAARQNVARHTKTGETMRNLRGRVSSDEIEFFDPAPQASFLEFGTRAHLIKPKNAKALRWVGPSGPIFATKVNHPGTRPRPWLAPAIEDHADTLIGVYGNAVEGEFSRG